MHAVIMHRYQKRLLPPADDLAQLFHKADSVHGSMILQWKDTCTSLNCLLLVWWIRLSSAHMYEMETIYTW